MLFQAAHCTPMAGHLGEAKTRERLIARFFLADDPEWSAVYQVVIPECYRQQVLSLAHDHDLSGHLGIKKTYHRVLRHFFWPCLKADVVQYCRTCRTCQLTGKPNQTIPSAPLVPIPAVGEPFEHVIVDCVGPLPKTRSGNQFLLTLMCSATRFPEAIPLRKITAPVVVKALVKFFFYFRLAESCANRSRHKFSFETLYTSFDNVEYFSQDCERLSP